MGPLSLVPFLCTLCLVCARLSGIYYDNGVDQTVIQRLLTRQEKREMEHEMLSLLGLPSRPKPRPSLPGHLGSSAPKFLLDVYMSLSDGPSMRTVRNEFSLSGKDQRAIDESDVIMSFLPQGRYKRTPSQHQACSLQKTGFLHFSVRIRQISNC